MIERLLKAKHWQIFILTFGIPILFQISLMAYVFSSIFNNADPNVDKIFDYFQVFGIIMFLFMSIYLGWMWAAAVGINKILREDLKLKVNRFKILFLIPLAYILIFSIYLNFMMNGNEGSFVDFNPGIFALIIPLHLFSMGCFFYCFYFIAKTIKTAELQKEVEFSDFYGEFFLIWFFPVGIWFLQPTINKIVKTYESKIE